MARAEHTASSAQSNDGPSVGTRLSAREIYDNVRRAAEEELERPTMALLWSSIAAGLIIGFSFLAAAFLVDLAAPAFKTAAVAIGYPLGFIFVVLARNQLFTENTLEPVIPLLHRPTRRLLQRLLALWAVVLAGNLLGAVVFAWLLAHTPLVNPEMQGTLRDVAHEGTSGGFVRVLYRAIFGGWLIALMAWLIASTRDTMAQVVLIWLTTAPIAAFGFRHSIAGSVEAMYLAFAGAAPWPQMLLGFLLPALLGNIAGGVLFVALLNHGQVAADERVQNKRDQQ